MCTLVFTIGSITSIIAVTQIDRFNVSHDLNIKQSRNLREEIMRKFLLLCLLLSGHLWADLSNPVQLSSGKTRMADHNSMDVKNETTYLVYKAYDDFLESTINFMRYSSDPIDQHVTTIWTESDGEVYDSPVIILGEDEQIAVFFCARIEGEDFPNLYQASSNDNGVSFDTELVDTLVEKAPIIERQGEDILLSYYNITPEPMGKYTYFSGTELSVNLDGGEASARLTFGNQDLVMGGVFSNDTVWMNNNSGDEVESITTAKNILPRIGEEVFSPILYEGELAVDANTLNLGTDIAAIEENGLRPFPENSDIVVVEINGSNFEAMAGEISFSEIRDIPVYSWYPSSHEEVMQAIDAGVNWFEESEIIAFNHVPVYDTTWTYVTGSVDNQSVFVDCDLLIKGNISGKQTWGCSGNAYITGDITYVNTIPGELPELESNSTDYFGLVAKNSVIVKYKYFDPLHNFELRDENCEDVEMYGIYAALGKGDEDLYGVMACHYDGIFSFEYQHPQSEVANFSSVSPYTGEDTLYTWIDFHKYIIPADPLVNPDVAGFNLKGQDHTAPLEEDDYLASIPNLGPEYVYPNGSELPFYNPVWPEAKVDVKYERGTINLYGSIVQRRRGFTHRSGSDPYNHDESMEWDLEEYHFGGTNPSTGYNKNYEKDSRLEHSFLPDFPSFNETGNQPNLYVKSYNFADNSLESIYDIALEANIVNYSFGLNDQVMGYLIQRSSAMMMLKNSASEAWLEIVLPAEAVGKAEKIVFDSDDAYVCYNDADEMLYIWKYSIENETWEMYHSREINVYGYDFQVSIADQKLLQNVTTFSNYLKVNLVHSEDGDALSHNFEYLTSFQFDHNGGRFPLFVDDESQIYISFHGLDVDYLYYFHGYMNGFSDVEPEVVVPELKPTLANYPNPFNPSTEIRFTAKDTQDTMIEIFNIKGQKVKSFAVSFDSAQHDKSEYSVTWNGTDTNNHSVASGIYYYTLKLDGKLEASRKMVLLK